MSDVTLKELQSTMSEDDFTKMKRKFEPCYRELSDMKSKRFIKTHIPIKLMPRSVQEVGAKIVYVARNPKDMCVSWYHMAKSFPTWAYAGDFQSFSEYFMNDLSKVWKFYH